MTGRTEHVRSPDEVTACIAHAYGEGLSLAARGAGSKADIGRGVEADLVLDISAMSGAIEIDAPEHVVTAPPATPVAVLQARAAEHNLMLGFEPVEHGRMLANPASATLGGVVAANAAGPRRVHAGDVRDNLLGFEAVSGTGQVFKAGGRVVKNVTGFDLCRLMAGAWGAYGVLTSVTLRLTPRPRHGATLLLRGLDAPSALAAMRSALRSPAAPTAAAHSPTQGWTALRVEDVARHARRDLLAHSLAEFGRVDALDDEQSAEFWSDVAAVKGLDGAAALWRLTLPPRAADALPGLLAKLDCAWLWDWGGALAWIACPARGEANARDIFAIAEALGGLAMLIRAPLPIRQRGLLRSPAPAPLRQLRARIKAAFDPAGILNPDRFSAPDGPT